MGRHPDRRTSRLLGSLGVVAGASAAPYGYSATVWGSGAVLLELRGRPGVGETFLFLAGIVTAFVAVAAISRFGVEASDRGELSQWLLTGALHALAIGLAVGAAALFALLDSWAAWPLAGFAATAVYLVVAAIERLAADALARRAIGGQEPADRR